MDYLDPEVRKSLNDLCKAYGFTRKRTCFYRCIGDGLLQVIKIPNNGMLSKYVFPDAGIYVGVFSLYAELNWIDSKAARHILQADLPVTLNAEDVFFTERDQTSGHNKDYHSILEKAIVCLSAIQTHGQLTSFMEENDTRFLSRVIWNDSNKIIPYVLSGQFGKATKCIDTIEQQNWSAYFANSKNSGYDREKHKCRIETTLSPIIRLREHIMCRNKDGVQEYLKENYSVNSQKLKELGVFLEKSSCKPLDKFLSDNM